MDIFRVMEEKKKYLSLLLLADEQESMLDRYLERGEMFALNDGGVKAVCVVTDEGGGVCELKNIATEPASQGKGYGKRLIEFLCDQYKNRFHTMIVGTGDSPLTLSFYQRCGFAEYRRVPNFFTDHYDHPIFECGRQLVDMVYLRRELL